MFERKYDRSNTLVLCDKTELQYQNYILPLLMRHTHSAVIAEEQQKLYLHYGTKLSETEYHIHCIDFQHPKESSRFNPFLYFRSLDAEDKFTDLIYQSVQLPESNPLFREPMAKTAVRLAVRYVLFFKTLSNYQRSFQTVYEVLKDISQNVNHASMYQTGKTPYAYRLETSASQAELQQLAEQVSFLNHPSMECMTEHQHTDNISIDKLCNSKTYIFLETDTNSQIALQWVFSLLLDACLHFRESNFRSRKMYKPVPVRFYLNNKCMTGLPNPYLALNQFYDIHFSVMLTPRQLYQYHPEWNHMDAEQIDTYLKPYFQKFALCSTDNSFYFCESIENVL